MLKENPCKIAIDGISIAHYVSLQLVQKINEHHHFEIALDNEIFILKEGTDIFSSKEYIGKSIYIEIEDYDFLGRITAMDFEMSKGEFGHTLLKGYSKTILLESGNRLKSWTDKTMPQIVKSILEASNMRGMIAPKTTFAIPYQCQYNESDFAYLKRLANQYNEWFYYEGEYLVFGKPKEEKSPIHLEYNQEVYEIKIATKTAAVSQRAYDFSYEGNNMLTASSKNDKVTSTLSEYALNAAMKLYPKESLGMPETVLADQYEVDRYLLGKTESVLSEFDVLEAKSKYVGLEIGSVIRLSSGEKYVGGNYLITEITHTQAQDKEYENHFKAISSNSRYLPAPKVTPLMAGTQRAMVIDHADPLHKGRVKVKMLWQENEMATNWIQVLAPDAGSSAVVGTNRGYVFIPEIGDQVLIGFHHNDPNRPFVLGNLHHADSAGGGQVNNNIKSIKTRSGHTIAFNDTERAESISITDRKGNHIIINTKEETISIKALRDINLKAVENINIEAGKDINVTAGNDMVASITKNNIVNTGAHNTISTAGDYKLMAANIYESADGNYEGQAENITKNAANNLSISAVAGNVTKHATQLNNNSNENTNFS
ncbi:type VI secretion system Vgr family protein [Tenacibaculum maritimum]|uniref:type VI secretion system Vgr family protein n=1 Tax=Tenacibaculum maritimum TaxID=107401 RepID=UPI0012E6A120|nr:phage baseplate assembly protein V [Tenacibaculum maritimum]MCD9582683.1 phage baseplate assembly protein V [Tenacibaculum maritimum]MCD9635777.1 phage baseplate assembly protein V [Tenacibaculum maritimum]CAA0163255.1 Rhs element Vgr protein [Tenacibaculum maritimum]CAA0165184.1 Rhs element Vgr protein [Tenacibaculum maritimum]CAA0175199.1 Rhs element Vgr protein [Tenacibaculum maritimum]